MTWRELTDALIAERGHGCEFCSEHAVDAHHALIYRNRKHKKLIDDKRNIVLVCRVHHVHSKVMKRWCWTLLCRRYGYETMCAWIENLPVLIKPRVEWLDGD